MATENTSSAAAAPAASAAVAAATGEVASHEISTDQLARNLGQQRRDRETAATAANSEAGDNEGQPGDEGAATEDLNAGGEGKTAAEIAAEKKGKDGKGGEAATGLAAGLQTLGLNAIQTAAVETAVSAGGGELDAEALGLTDAQVEGLTQLLAGEAGEAAGAEPELEALDLSEVPKLTPDQGKRVGELYKQRLGKVIARERSAAEALVATERTARTAAETRSQQLEQQLAQARSAPVSAGKQPLAEIQTAEQLNTAAANAKAVKNWCGQQLRHVARNPDAVKQQLEAAGVKLAEYTPEAMEDYLTEQQIRADETLTEHVPARQRYLQQEAQFSAGVSKDHPWLDDPKDERYAYTQGALQTFPELKRVPHWKAILAVIGTGMKALNDAKAAAAAKGKTPTIKIIPRKPGKVTVRAAGARTVTTKKNADATAADEQFKSTGSVADLARSFGAKRNAA